MKASELIYGVTQSSGVFGRNKDVSVLFEGEGAYTDGQQIVIPAIAQQMEFNHEDVMVIRGYIDHEAGHVRHTDFEALEKFATTNTPECKNIWNCLEDMWLEDRVMREYPGSKKNLNALRVATGGKEKEHQLANETFEKLTYGNAMTAILRAGSLAYAGKDNEEMYEHMPQQWKDWGNKWASEAKACRNSSEIMNLAIAIEKMIEKENQEDQKQDQQEGEGEQENSSVMDGNPSDFTFDKDGDITQGNPAKSKEQMAKEAKEGKGDKSDKRIDMNDFMEEWIRSKEDTFIDFQGMEKGKKYKVLTTRYDEVYTRTSTNSRPHKLQKKMQNAPISDYEQIKGKLGSNIHTMKAKLRRALLSRERRDWDFGRESGRLDPKRLVAGKLGAPNVFRQRQDREEYDTAVHLLVDQSGSMGDEKIVVAQESIVAFCECLQGTQIKYQVSGFNNDSEGLVRDVKKGSGSYGRTEPLNLFVYKPFNEGLQINKGAVSNLRYSAGGNNSDYDAVLWASEELKVMPNKRKVLIVLSDGQPWYNKHNYERRWQNQVLKDLVVDLEKKMEVVGIGILDTAVKEYYTKSISINNVNDLSGTIFNQLSNILVGGKVRL